MLLSSCLYTQINSNQSQQQLGAMRGEDDREHNTHSYEERRQETTEPCVRQ